MARVSGFSHAGDCGVAAAVSVVRKRSSERCAGSLPTLWALTVVHEVTHIDCSTKDHRYDNAGLKCGPMFDPDRAVENADS